jgi:hypothetical protein
MQHYPLLARIEWYQQQCLDRPAAYRFGCHPVLWREGLWRGEFTETILRTELIGTGRVRPQCYEDRRLLGLHASRNNH